MDSRQKKKFKGVHNGNNSRQPKDHCSKFQHATNGGKSKPIGWNNGRGSDLPIFSHKEELVSSVKKYKTTVVIGETGSGKSTQLPKFLAEVFTSDINDKKGKTQKSGNCIVCTQPRRVAAITVAQRVAQELEVECGKEVGYAVRFDDSSCAKTRVKFVTDGVLLRECMTDPNLSSYSVIILDESHERSLNTDILMGLLKELQEKNPQLRLVIMSATLQADIFMKFFADTNLIHIEGRQYPVEVMYTKKPEVDYVDAAVRTCMHIHQNCPLGGVLVFLPGQEDIEAMMALLQENLPSVECYAQTHKSRRRKRDEYASGSDESDADVSERGEQVGKPIDRATAMLSHKAPSYKDSSSVIEGGDDGPIEVIAAKYDFELRPLYASMPPDQQLRAFKPCVDPSARKFILATNIAETSVTINDIKYVVDTGYYKSKLLDGTTAMETLKTIPVSKQQADQRRGRAGRTGPGQCYRIYTEDVYEEHLPTEALPEIQRVSIAQVVLQLKAIGVKSPQHFAYISPPSTDAMRRAMQELLLLGALGGDDAHLTPFGQMMSRLPLEPMYSALLLHSAKCADGSFIGSNSGSAPVYKCVQEMLTTVSMLSADGIYIQPHSEQEKQIASKKHRALSVKAGDLPTLLHIYNSWVRSRMAKDWALGNFISQRALQQAYNVRGQLSDILRKVLYTSQNSQLLESEQTFPSCLPEQEPYLRCLALGLCLNVAQRVEGTDTLSNNVSNNRPLGKHAKDRVVDTSHLAPYVTLRGRQPVHVHPSSVLFSLTHSHKYTPPNSKGASPMISTTSKNKLPQFVVFSDLLVTTKSYMRGVTKIEGDWLLEIGGVAGGLFKKVNVDKPLDNSSQAAAAAYKSANLNKGNNGTSKTPSHQKKQDMTPRALASNQGRTAGLVQVPTSNYVSLAKKKEIEKKLEKKRAKEARKIEATSVSK